MGNSGIEWIDITFNWCVRLLYDVAAYIGISYEEINIYLFIIIHPLITLMFFSLWIYERRNRSMK